eukprot:256533_1
MSNLLTFVAIIWVGAMAQLLELQCGGDKRQVAYDGYVSNYYRDTSSGAESWRCQSRCGLNINTICNDGKLQFDSFGKRSKQEHDFAKPHTKIDSEDVARRGFKVALENKIRGNKGKSTANEYFAAVRREHPYFVDHVKGFESWRNFIYAIKDEYGPPKTPYDPAEIEWA